MAPSVNTVVAPATTASDSQSTFRYRANRISSTAYVNGFRQQMKYTTGLDCCTSHSGYSAEEAKNIGKITKFITPAKFSNCLMPDDSSIPSEPIIMPDRIRAGITAT